MYKIKKYGWKRSLPVFGPKFEKPACLAAIPASADISNGMPGVYDQLEIGSCTANAAAALAAFLTKKDGWKSYTPARLAIYYWARLMQGTISEDSGASLAEVAHVLASYGAPNETLFPYDITKFTRTPTSAVIANGKGHLVINPMQVRQDLNDIRACIAAGFPIMFGFAVYESFESDLIAYTGIMSMPEAGEQVVGGHAVIAVGYNDHTKQIKVRNSWGNKWGQAGYFQMPYDFIENRDLCDDFWTAHSITGWRDHAMA